MKNILILGSGMVGSAIARDLSNFFHVTVADINESQLENIRQHNQNIETILMDARNVQLLQQTAKQFDIIVGCLPGFLGFQTIRSLISLQKPIVDISFFPEDIFDLEQYTKTSTVPVVVDCGVAPGLGNIILGYHASRMDVQSYKCYVGGLPKVRQWPWEYKAVFSPIDVIEEYIRPARFRVNGQLVIKEALSDAELIDFEHVGTLEAWNSDGLRSLLKSYPHIPDMIEKTMRYPGTIEYLKVLRDTGFFSYEPVYINNQPIRPIDLTARLLFPKWQMTEQDEDITVMRIEIKGIEQNRQVIYTYDLFDTKLDGVTSMARTTGYTCCAAVHAIASEIFTRKGLCPPEVLGENEQVFHFILQYLKERNIKMEQRISYYV